jgi:hypothetical protein
VVDAAEEAVLLALTLALGLFLVVVVASDVGDEVHGPAAELLQHRVEEGRNGRLLGQLVQLVGELTDARGILVSRLGNKDHVALHVAGGLVVLAVGDLPGEVGDEKRGVGNEADRVVEHLGGREGLVAALVGHDPEAGAEQALDDRVAGPQSSPGGL